MILTYNTHSSHFAQTPHSVKRHICRFHDSSNFAQTPHSVKRHICRFRQSPHFAQNHISAKHHIRQSTNVAIHGMCPQTPRFSCFLLFWLAFVWLLVNWNSFWLAFVFFLVGNLNITKSELKTISS